MTDSADIERDIKAYILEEFLPGEDPNSLTPTTPLLSAGILDSIATLKLVLFLEQRFGVSLAAHETDAEHIDTIERIGQLVASKRT